MTTKQRQRVLDWRFLLVLTIMLAFVWMIVAGIQAQRNFQDSQATGKAKSARIGLLINELQDQTVRTEQNTAAFENNQRVLLAYTAALAGRQAALLHYLARHGVKIPEKFLEPVQVPQLTITGPTSAPPTRKVPPGQAKKSPKASKEGKRRS